MKRIKRGNPEAHLLLQCLKFLAISGWYCGKIKVKGSFTKQGAFIFDRYLMRGLPDALAFKNGVILAIETKVGKNILTPEQQIFKQQFHLLPTRIYAEIRTFEELEKILKEIS